MQDTLQLSPLASTPDWQLFTGARARQRSAGFFAAIALALGLIVLVDGLVSQMRGGGSFRIEMLAGTSEAVSGPMGNEKAVASDMEAFPIPVDAPLSFEFQGFFASYWFGSGMWRGSIHARDGAPSGVYGIAIGLKGTPASAHQTYTVVISGTTDEQNRQSLSFLRRFTGWNPFILAAVLLAAGAGAGLGAFFLGRRSDGLLRSLGLAEIFRTAPEGDFLRVFFVTGKREITEKNFVAWDCDLHRLGKVIFDRTSSGVTECLFVRDSGKLPEKGCFVACWDRELPPEAPVRRGLFHPGGRDARDSKEPGKQ